MKSLRRSLHKDPGQPPTSVSGPVLPALSKPLSAIVPPKKVIRAFESYRSTNPQELSFQKGDFFHVLRDTNPQDMYFEANNPLTGARGLVPKRLFEEFSKSNAAQ